MTINFETKSAINSAADVENSPIQAIRAQVWEATDTPTRALNAAVQSLCDGWQSRLNAGCRVDLISDIQCVVEQLWAFTPIARKHLPIQNGGFAGFSPEQCLASLKSQGIAVYGPCDLGAYGFTNCGLDEFASFDDALNAALQAHPEAVSMLSKETC